MHTHDMGEKARSPAKAGDKPKFVVLKFASKREVVDRNGGVVDRNAQLVDRTIKVVDSTAIFVDRNTKLVDR
ncbi:hypothetical protein FZC84_13970 [Rossellomorea vietnamensis]|uniref:Uncharacterized protein n=1 Tax=Rossellomorea vietnamensis TaxID=218284 RepID=A0A5D4MBZ8_9BACI|nr:hypothetical protein [Rossellomorea vietnamensis]TYR98535.1 hypothetical protein FZC84_13970 [Rossellomorea vietnamensis]